MLVLSPGLITSMTIDVVCYYRLKPMLRDARLIRQCKRGVLQFVIVKPASAVLSVVMLSLGVYHTPAYQAFILTIYNISYTVALYFLFVFYLATKVRSSDCEWCSVRACQSLTTSVRCYRCC